MNQSLRPDKATLVELFRDFIEPQYVINDAETQKPFECDGLSVYCDMPLITVLPETVEQVREVMRICYRYRIPVVARGAGTGLCAGAMPDANGVGLVCCRFKHILDIDPLARSERLQKGLR